MKLSGVSDVYIVAMKHKKLRITEKDFLLANRRAARDEEIRAFGKQILFRTATHKSKKVYDRNSQKRADIKSDDGSFRFYGKNYSFLRYLLEKEQNHDDSRHFKEKDLRAALQR